MNNIKEKILKEIEGMEVIDSHEHLLPEEEAVKNKRDIFSLFSHYTLGDLQRAGMREEQIQLIFNQDISLDVRWKEFYPFWEKIRYTCYSKSVLLSVKKFYGYDDVNESNYKDISIALDESYKPGIYKKVLRNTCNIKVALTQCFRTDVDHNKKDPMLIPIMPIWTGCGSTVSSWKDFQYLGALGGFKYLKDWKYRSIPIRTLDDCLENQKEYLRKIKDEGAVGVKLVTYPKLDLNHEPDRKEAEELFNDFKRGKIKKLPQPNDLHYYLLDKAVSFAAEEGFVIAVHTGYWGDFRDLSPLNIIPFIMRNPEGKFDVYHLGYPWIRESIMLGKGFSNVYINFCWLSILSQKAAREAMDEVIETIPTNKVIGFGGDYKSPTVEKIYGHLTMAKEDIAEVIAGKISQGWMDFNSGVELIKKFFYSNPKDLYNLK